MTDRIVPVRYIDGGTGPQAGHIPVFADDLARVHDSGVGLSALLGAIGTTGLSGFTGLIGPTGFAGETGLYHF